MHCLANKINSGEAFYVATAQKLNLDLDKFNRDRNLADASIQKDLRLAEELGLSGTPFFILNGEVLTGAVQLSDFEKILARVETEATEASQQSGVSNQESVIKSQESADGTQESADKS